MTRRLVDPVDRVAITDLIFAYAEFVDEARVGDLGRLFTDDATLDYGNGRHCDGNTQVVAFVTERLSLYRATSHHLSNVSITPTGSDTASVKTYVYAFHERSDGDQAEIWGRYLDDVVRTVEGWKIAVRRIRTAGLRGFTLPPGQQSPFEQMERRTLP